MGILKLNQKGSIEAILDWLLAGSVGLFVGLTIYSGLYSNVSSTITHSGENAALTQTIYNLIPFLAVVMVVIGIVKVASGRRQQPPTYVGPG